jgi:hypothetical protein
MSLPGSKTLEGKRTSWESVSLNGQSGNRLRGKEAAWVGSNVRVGRKVMRGELIFCRKSDLGIAGKTSGCIREEKHEEGVLNQ